MGLLLKLIMVCFVLMTCVVYGCSNNNYNTADLSAQYYIFPKHCEITQKWIEASGWPADQIDINSARICSIHFDDNSYTTEIKMIDYITCYTKVLKYDAFPTLYLPQVAPPIKNSPSNSREGPQEMIVFTRQPPDTKQPVLELQIQPLMTLTTPEMEKYRQVTTREQLTEIEGNNHTLQQNITTLESNIKNLKAKLNNLSEVCQQKDLDLCNAKEEFWGARTAAMSLYKQRQLLGKVFSQPQIKILSGKKKIYWSDDDMAVGYTIRHLGSRSCYVYLTKKLNIPLPAVSSIKRWITSTNTKEKPLEDGSDKIEDEDSD